MDDRDLKKHILEELDFEPKVDAADIGVSVENGVVTLHGHVAGFTEKMAAESAAERVSAVAALLDEIEVRLPGDPAQYDDDLARRAVQVLHWDPLVDADDVGIRVQHGEIDLSGQVARGFQKRRAEKLLSDLPGLRAIHNHLSVRPRPTKRDVKKNH